MYNPCCLNLFSYLEVCHKTHVIWDSIIVFCCVCYCQLLLVRQYSSAAMAAPGIKVKSAHPCTQIQAMLSLQTNRAVADLGGSVFRCIGENYETEGVCIFSSEFSM